VGDKGRWGSRGMRRKGVMGDKREENKKGSLERR